MLFPKVWQALSQMAIVLLPLPYTVLEWRCLPLSWQWFCRFLGHYGRHWYPVPDYAGANPVVVGAMGLTVGYCGTLLTPMAANFNIMPAALLETKSKYAVIKAQAPMAVVMLIIHIFLMYFLAF